MLILSPLQLGSHSNYFATMQRVWNWNLISLQFRKYYSTFEVSWLSSVPPDELGILWCSQTSLSSLYVLCNNVGTRNFRNWRTHWKRFIIVVHVSSTESQRNSLAQKFLMQQIICVKFVSIQLHAILPALLSMNWSLKQLRSQDRLVLPWQYQFHFGHS